MFIFSYKILFSWGDVFVFVIYIYVGLYMQDIFGLQQLGSYYIWDFGVVVNIQQNWQLCLQGINMINELGLIESNLCIFGVVSGINGVILVCLLEGCEVNVQVKYLF